MDPQKIYPREGNNGKESVYLQSVVKDPNISIGDFTIYNDFVNNPCGTKFMFTGGNHTLKYMKP